MNRLAYRISRIFLSSLLALGICSSAMASPSSEGIKTLYGWHLMSQSERNHFRYLMQFQKTAEDKEKFLILHKLKMQIRASQGATPATIQKVATQNFQRTSMSGRVRR